MGDFPWQKDPDGERDRWRRSRMPWQREPEVDTPGDPDPVPATHDPELPAPELPEEIPHESEPADPVAARRAPEAPPASRADHSEASTPVPVPSDPPEQRPSRPQKAGRSAKKQSRQDRTRSATPTATAPKTSTGSKIVTGVVITLVGGGIISGIVNSDDEEDGPSYERTAAEESDLRRQLSDTVTGYFDAIMEADAVRALTYVDAEDLGDADQSFLTDEILAAAQDRAPIDRVTITSIDLDPQFRFHASAEVAYLLDGEETGATIDLWNHASSDDTWNVGLDNRALIFRASTFEGLRPNVYGIDVEVDSSVLLFPGVYEVSFPDSPHLALDEMPGIVADSSPAGGTDIVAVTFPLGDDAYIDLGVSKSGRASYAEAVMASIDACISSTRADSVCAQIDGSAADDGAVDGTVTRHLDEEFSDLDFEPRPIVDDHDRLRDITTVGAKYEATCEGGAECTGMEYFGYPVVDFGTGSTRVTWESID